MKLKYWIYLLVLLSLSVLFGLGILKTCRINTDRKIGEEIDSLHGVAVYYNGITGNVSSRNRSEDGYNLGLKYQCVEFVKRYYWKHLNHKMPNSYGHAKDFFNQRIPDGATNEDRNLVQYSNPSKSKPQADDLVVFSENIFNQFGHVAIISAVGKDKIEIIQQNPGVFSSSREIIALEYQHKQWKIKNSRIKGWLRKVTSKIRIPK